MNRREFTQQLTTSALAFGLIELIWSQDGFADEIKPTINDWFTKLVALGNDLHGQKLKDTEFQAKMEELYRQVNLADLLTLVKLEAIDKSVKLPEKGAHSAGFDLSKVEGMPKKINFGKQIFCLKKGRAIVPHGHENMCTGFIVLKGNFRGRHYDRLETKADHYIIKPTIDQEFKAGGVSTISDHKDNIHWFECLSDAGFIFNAHFTGYDPTITEASGRLYLDPDGEKLSGGTIKAKKMSAQECHKKFG